MTANSEWTVATLKTHIEDLRTEDRTFVKSLFDEKEKALQAALAAQEKMTAAALAAADKATSKAEANAEKWRENANEWRGAMSDRDRELPSRREVETMIDALTARIDNVEKFQDRASGQREGFRFTGAVIGGIVATVAAVVVVINVVIALTVK